MSASADLDPPRALTRPGVEDRLAFAFATGDGAASGMAELAVQSGERGERNVRAHAILFSQGKLASSAAAPPSQAQTDAWEETTGAGVRTVALESPGRWSLAYRDESGAGFELEFEGLGPPVEFGSDTAVARSTGVEGFEELGRVRGTVTVAGRTDSLEGRGQRGRAWGPTDLGGAGLARRVGAWLARDAGLVLWAARPRRARAHDAEAVSAFLVEGQSGAGRSSGGEPGGVQSAGGGADAAQEAPGAGEFAVTAIEEARLSTTYDGEGHPVRAGLELWPTAETEYPRRLGGEVVGSALLDLGVERLEGAFLAWRMEGRAGVGWYELRRPT